MPFFTRRRVLVIAALIVPFASVAIGSYFMGPALDLAEDSSLIVRGTILGTISVVYAPEFLAAEAVERFQPIDMWGASVPTEAGKRWRLILSTCFRFGQGVAFVMLLPLLGLLWRISSRLWVVGRPTAVAAYVSGSFVLAGLLACGGYALFLEVAQSTTIAADIALR